MYEIVGKSKPRKQFEKLVKKLSANLRKKLNFTLESNPYPSPSYGKSLCKIEKKGAFYCYETSGGDRILFVVIEKPAKKVLILFAGNDDEEQRFLKKYR